MCWNIRRGGMNCRSKQISAEEPQTAYPYNQRNIQTAYIARWEKVEAGILHFHRDKRRTIHDKQNMEIIVHSRTLERIVHDILPLDNVHEVNSVEGSLPDGCRVNARRRVTMDIGIEMWILSFVARIILKHSHYTYCCAQDSMNVE